MKEILDELVARYGDEFCWFAPSNAEAFEKQLARELSPACKLANLKLKAVLKSGRNDDVIFMDGAKFYLVHLAWSGAKNLTQFREIENLKAFLQDDFLNG